MAAIEQYAKQTRANRRSKIDSRIDDSVYPPGYALRSCGADHQVARWRRYPKTQSNGQENHGNRINGNPTCRQQTGQQSACQQANGNNPFRRLDMLGNQTAQQHSRGTSQGHQGKVIAARSNGYCINRQQGCWGKRLKTRGRNHAEEKEKPA